LKKGSAVPTGRPKVAPTNKNYRQIVRTVGDSCPYNGAGRRGLYSAV